MHCGSNFPSVISCEVESRGDYFRFDSVFIKKKIIKSNFKKNDTEPKPVQTDRFRFGSVF